MKKITLSMMALMAVLGLTACNKQEAPKADQPSPTNEQPTKPAETASNNPPPAQTAPNTDHNHDHHDHDHGHEGHNHEHMDAGDKYECGKDSVQIVVHNHEGEKEAHLTKDNITYDLSEDVQSQGRFTSDDSIAGEDKGMVLVIGDNTAKVTTLDNKVLLDCTKSKS